MTLNEVRDEIMAADPVRRTLFVAAESCFFACHSGDKGKQTKFRVSIHDDGTTQTGAKIQQHESHDLLTCLEWGLGFVALPAKDAAPLVRDPQAEATAEATETGGQDDAEKI
ncbi:MAG: hypothetical protein HQ559_01825 [Lentisphaerae bacterium]|nr:hypothetical protein [Lentisphaerota bacterium]